MITNSEYHKEIKKLQEKIGKQRANPSGLSTIEKQLPSVLDVIAGIHWWKDKDSIYRGCNNAMVIALGLQSKHDIIGKSDYDLPWAKQAAFLVHNDKNVMESETIQIDKEELVETQDGVIHTFLVTKAPLYNIKKEIIGTIGCSVDITHMKNQLQSTTKKAEVANHAKTEFIANISHDIRTALTGIITFSRFLKEQDDLSAEERKELATDTYNASEQLLHLLNGVLDVVSADFATDNDLHLQSFDVLQMLEELIKLQKPAVKSRHLELKKSIDINIPRYLVSDKMKLHRVLLNLIGNAIKFTEKGYIALTATLQAKDHKKATIIISIEDSGIGIPEEAQPQIFDRFYKVNASYKSQYQGNGIGLHIVQKYVQLLDGEIDFRSILGKGTIFSITLTLPLGEVPKEDIPCSKVQEEATSCAKQPSLNSSFLSASNPIDSKIKILLVEDNTTALKALKMLCRPFPLHIMEAQNAEDAFELVKKNVFDLIITDIGLPKMQGDELVAKIREWEKESMLSRGNIVALTGHAIEGEFADNCRKAGIDTIFAKPMRSEVLKRLLHPLIEKEQQTITPAPKPELYTTLSNPLLLKTGNLGLDLPDTAAQLFEINHHPLLDMKVGEALLGSEEAVREILRDLYKTGIEPDLEKIIQAHADKNWDRVRALAHKMKGGSTLGTVRLYYAFLYMERYIKAGHTHCAEAVYSQMLTVIHETVRYLETNL